MSVTTGNSQQLERASDSFNVSPQGDTSDKRSVWHQSVRSALGSIQRQQIVKPDAPSTNNMTTGRKLQYNLWLGIRASLKGARSISEERARLKGQRDAFKGFPGRVLNFRLDSNGPLSALDTVNDLLGDYSRLLDLYPSQRALEEDMLCFALPKFKVRIDAIVSWLNIWNSAKLVSGRLHFLVYGNPFHNPGLSLEHQPTTVFILGSLRKLFYKRFVDRDMLHIFTRILDDLDACSIELEEMNLSEHVVDLGGILSLFSSFQVYSVATYVKNLDLMKGTREESTVDFCTEVVKRIEEVVISNKIFSKWENTIFKSEQDLHRRLGVVFGNTFCAFVNFLTRWIATIPKFSLFRFFGFNKSLWATLPEIGSYSPSKLCDSMEGICQMELQFIQNVLSMLDESDARCSYPWSIVRNRRVELLRRPLVHLLEFLQILRSYITVSADVKGQLVDKNHLFSCLRRDNYTFFAQEEYAGETLLLFGSPALCKDEQALERFSKGYVKCTFCYYSNDPTSHVYVVIFRGLTIEGWDGPVHTLERSHFLAEHFPTLANLHVVPNLALDQCPLSDWFLPSYSISREVFINNEITALARQVTSKTVNLALFAMEMPDTAFSKIGKAIEIKLAQKTFLFLATYAAELEAFLEKDPALQQTLLQGLVLLAIKWSKFGGTKHPILPFVDMKRATLETLDFVMTISSNHSLLKTLSENQFGDLRQYVSLCLKNLLLPQPLFLVTEDDLSAELIMHRIHSKSNLSRKERVMLNVQKCEERASKSTVVGRVLDPTASLLDRNLARLSSEAPTARVKWQKGRFLNRGASGTVYLATNFDTGNYMAVKEVMFQEEADVDRIRRSESILGLLHHPNICHYYGVEIHRDKVYILMEYCPGSLERILKQGRIGDEQVIKHYVCQMLRGLHYLHSQDIVHHDVKPSNILFDTEGTLKFIDFGCSEIEARNAIVKSSRTFKLVGTARYLPPEVVRNESASSPTAQDIWALGCTIIQMATGKEPWHELDNEWAVMFQLGLGHSPTLPTVEELSPAGTEFIRACLTQSPSERPTALDLFDHLWLIDMI